MTENSKQSELQIVTNSSRGEAMGCPGVPLQHQGPEGADAQAPPTQPASPRQACAGAFECAQLLDSNELMMSDQDPSYKHFGKSEEVLILYHP